MHDIRAQALGTLFYCANWVIIFAKSNYFTTIGRPSPFLHMWTLAVEEQFYLVLPLVFFAARRVIVRHPVRAAVVALVGAVASTVWMAMLVSPTGDPLARTSGAIRTRWVCSSASRSACSRARAGRGTTFAEWVRSNRPRRAHCRARRRGRRCS